MSLYTCFSPLPKDVNYFSKKGQTAAMDETAISVNN